MSSRNNIDFQIYSIANSIKCTCGCQSKNIEVIHENSTRYIKVYTTCKKCGKNVDFECDKLSLNIKKIVDILRKEYDKIKEPMFRHVKV